MSGLVQLLVDADRRDPEFPCDEFRPGEPAGRCQTDGHYLCHECVECQLCEGGCGQIEARCECSPAALREACL